MFSVLEAACYAQQSAAQQAAMINLQDFESLDGFATSLIQIIDSEQVPDSKSDCRLLAVITLKNVVSRCWKSRGSTVHLLNSHEKSYLKEFTLKRAVCKEKDSRVLTQLSVLMAQVAKVEWPADWPQLLPSLFDDLKSGELQPTLSSSSKNDAMILFYSVVVELASKTTPNAKNEFKNSAHFMFPYFAKTLETLSLNLIALLPECCKRDQNFQSDSLRKANILAEQLSIVTNILDIFVSKIFTTISNTPDFASFFIFLLDQKKKYTCYLQCQSLDTIESFTALSDRYSLPLINSTGNDGWDIDKVIGNIQKNGGDNGDASVFILLLRVSNIANKISSIPVALQKEHPLEMVPYLESFLELFHEELTNTFSPTHGISGRAGTLFKNILSLTRSSCISAILFISNIISCKVYSTKTNSVAKLKEKLNFQFKLPSGSPGDIDAKSSQVSHDSHTTNVLYVLYCHSLISLIVVKTVRYQLLFYQNSRSLFII